MQDAYFLFPSKNADGIIETISLGTDSDGKSTNVQGFYLEGNTTFTNEKPYVIYGYCTLPENKTLTIESRCQNLFSRRFGFDYRQGCYA